MEIVTFVPDSIKENPYIADIAQLIEARNADAEAGKDPLNTAVTYVWPVAEVNKEKVALSKAANLAGYTARKRHEENVDNEDGSKSLKLWFTLTSKHKDRRNKEREHAAKLEEEANTDNSEAIEAPVEEVNEESANDENSNGEETAAQNVESTPVARRPRKR